MRTIRNHTPDATKRRLWLWPLVLLIAILLTAAVAVLWLKSQINQTGFTDNTASRRIVMGDDALNIPLNYMRFAKQRKATTLRQADLVMLYPSGNGYSPADAEKFKQNAGLIFTTLKPREQGLDMSARLVRVYRKLLSVALA